MGGGPGHALSRSTGRRAGDRADEEANLMPDRMECISSGWATLIQIENKSFKHGARIPRPCLSSSTVQVSFGSLHLLRAARIEE